MIYARCLSPRWNILVCRRKCYSPPPSRCSSMVTASFVDCTSTNSRKAQPRATPRNPAQPRARARTRLRNARDCATHASAQRTRLHNARDCATHATAQPCDHAHTCMYIHRALHSWCQFCRRDRLLGGGIRPGGAPLSNEHYKAAVTAAEGRLPKLRNICEAAVAAVADQADDGV